ncbi:MAG TPA: hypothetical protein VNA69_10285 [Thermoanaerobaculia bacterium]|nr:hypothetical protein [Thermoanaerobaculia bacterium]
MSVVRRWACLCVLFAIIAARLDAAPAASAVIPQAAPPGARVIVTDVRKVLGEPSAVVSEEDTQGPGATGWVYQEHRCVAHVLEGRVRSVSFE